MSIIQTKPSNSTEQARLNTLRRYYKRPNAPMSQKTVAKLIRAGVDPKVARIDLELVKLALQSDRNWSIGRCEVAELEYKRLLTLHLWNRNLRHPLVPTALVDEMWHKHILDTRAYHADMEGLFGEYLHHFPFLGFRSEQSKRLKMKAFRLTCKLYQLTFGEPFTESAKKLAT